MAQNNNDKNNVNNNYNDSNNDNGNDHNDNDNNSNNNNGIILHLHQNALENSELYICITIPMHFEKVI